MQSLALNVEVLNAKGEAVTLKEEEWTEADRASEELGINLSKNESLAAETDFTSF